MPIISDNYPMKGLFQCPPLRSGIFSCQALRKKAIQEAGGL
jgi:hypothetical protein